MSEPQFDDLFGSMVTSVEQLAYYRSKGAITVDDVAAMLEAER